MKLGTKRKITKRKESNLCGNRGKLPLDTTTKPYHNASVADPTKYQKAVREKANKLAFEPLAHSNYT